LATGAIALAAFAAGFVRIRRPACGACGRVEPAWLFAPGAAPRATAADAATTTAPGDAASVAAAAPSTGRRGFLAAAGALGASGVATAAAGFGGVLVRQ